MGISFGKPSIASVFDDVKFWANFPQEYARSGNWSNFYDAAQGLRIDQINSFSSRTNLPNLGTGFDCPNFNGSVYYRCSEAAGTTVDMAGPTTLVMWIKSFDMTERDTIFEKNGTNTNSYRQEIACTWETGETISWYSRPGNYDYGSTASIGTNGDWKMVSIKMTTAKISGTNRAGYYSIDGGNYAQNYTARSTTVPTPAGELRMGTGYAGAVEGGSMSQCLVWDRELSNTEINQVWQDTRSWHSR
jgi:hypothetical protein